ncbi:MAG TPA: sulfatase-like hydrolase/transferase, partial [Chthonomonadales bacterium]|nr:sulfatase-like hydrolase/transferase [Chthonomonadales bacterium]
GPVTDAEYIASLYDAEIRHVDDGIAELLASLDTLGLTEDTLVVLTGDHGESLYSHDIYFDHHGLYEDVIRVPLLIRNPSRIARDLVISPMAQHLDLVPTLLEATGAPSYDRAEGLSWWRALTGAEEGRGWSEIVCCECTWQAKWALRSDSAKLIVAREPDRHGNPEMELYDLAEDPLEEHNLAESRTAEAAWMRAQLEEWIAAGLKRVGRATDPLVAQGLTLGKRWDDWIPKTETAAKPPHS